MTPEEIVALIGNIGNRPDIREVHVKQVHEIKELVQREVLKERQACLDIAEGIYDGWIGSGPEVASIACSQIVWHIEKRNK